MQTIILILTLLLSGPFLISSQNQKFFVNFSHPKASDTNKGSFSHPFKTINKAAQFAGPGDTVFVSDGVYREWVAPVQGI